MDSAEHTGGFWLRMQTIEPAVHRREAESTTGTPVPVDTEIAVDAVPQTFETMAPSRRAVTGARPGRCGRPGRRTGFALTRAAHSGRAGRRGSGSPGRSPAGFPKPVARPA
ncbi:hypothetical protein [Streptomyces sp. NPDC097981]|uniref:hypothetical protein n=1 Tax=Streptomyces sp. NPDC097981 TaxID=3155428 RepID=UPI003332425E